MPTQAEIRMSVLARVLGHCDHEPETVNDATQLQGELGLDSLDLLEVLMEVEEDLTVELDDTRIGNVRTVGEFIAWVEQEIRGQQ